MQQPVPDTLITLLRSSHAILIFTGAGISTASGIPDFRGPQGLWNQRKPVYYREFMTSEVARIEYWEYKLEGWESFRDAKPNAVHHAIAQLENQNRVLLVATQNIDGLHAAAGTSPRRLVELHGTNAAVECQSCGARSDPAPHFAYFRQHHTPPLCSCGGYLKPATISFGQNLNEDDLLRAQIAADHADLVIALGSTLSVYPAASIPLLAAGRGIPYIIINRGATEHDGHPAVSLRLEGDVTEIFPYAVNEALR
jgi:NAD-dependent deacetylase